MARQKDILKNVLNGKDDLIYKSVSARTENQKLLLQSIDKNIITICTGPAGSGRTHCSVGMAVKYLQQQKVERIVICRPMIESGEQIGHLPGMLEEKTLPFLIPIFDELHKFVPSQEIIEWKKNRKLEICPLGYMRGRTFSNTFVILDEAQNAKLDQLRMLLTRLGDNGKIVINGDINQSDLPKRYRGGLQFCIERLIRIPEIGIIELTSKDIVRHPLIGTIIERLEE